MGSISQWDDFPENNGIQAAACHVCPCFLHLLCSGNREAEWQMTVPAVAQPGRQEWGQAAVLAEHLLAALTCL